MNIVLIHYAAPPIVGGVESVMGRHARLMTEAGHRVRIIAGRGSRRMIGSSLAGCRRSDSRNPEVLALKADLDAGRMPTGFEPLVERIASGGAEACGGGGSGDRP